MKRVNRNRRLPADRRCRAIAKRNRAEAPVGGLSWLPGAWLVVERPSGRIIMTSPKLNELLGCQDGAMVGRSMLGLTGRDEGAGWGLKSFDASILEHQGVHEDIGLRREDGSIIGVDAHISHPPRDAVDPSTRPVALCLVTDRTEQRRLQGELIGKHQELRRAFMQLTKKSNDLIETQAILENRNREISDISEKLSRASELAAISEITAELTHHLNNPLAAAISAQRQLTKIYDTTALSSLSNDRMATMLGLLKNSLERMKATAADLRRVYKSSRPLEMPQNAFDLRKQVEDALIMIQHRLTNVEVNTELSHELSPVLGRPTQIQHVVVNLLNNAVDAIGQRGQIVVRAANADGKVAFAVGDSGPGISKDLREKVFEPFYSTREDGSGIGLAVVRRNCQLDGATVEIGQSELGGAEIRIVFQSALEKEGKDDS